MAFRNLLSIAALCSAMALAPTGSFAQTEPQQAPANPALQRWLQRGGGLRTAAPGSYAMGYIPSGLDLSHLDGQRPRRPAGQLTLVRSFDLRTLGRLTAVRDQGSCGACWTFASLASLESSLMPTEVRDFSENNLKNGHGFAWLPCDGGNRDMATAYLARWSGPVDEVDDPYVQSAGTSPVLPAVKLVEEVLYLGSRTGSLDNDGIKTALSTYNTAVYTSLLMDTASTNFNATQHSYLYRGTDTDTNHAVAIVGWDDDFAASHFSPAAPGNGAFVVRNSWGSSWGDNGYFYVSYYDPFIGTENAVFRTPSANSQYSVLHSYDRLGWTSSCGWASSNTGWGANIFSSAGNERLAAVGFYSASANSAYEIYVYGNVTAGSPRSGTLLAGPVSGTLPYAGYHTVALPSSGVVLATSQSFSVVLKLTTPGYNYPVPMETPGSTNTASATAHAGESFGSSDGTGWSDVTTWSWGANSNIALKAFGVVACNDGNPCTTERWSGTACLYTPAANGTSCDDGLVCTGGDQCQAGACRGTPTVGCAIAGACLAEGAVNPANPCERCASAASAAAWSPAPAGTACDDGLWCNGPQACVGNVCTAGTPPSCDDHIACTLDTCTETVGCDHVLQAGSCYIGGACYANGESSPAANCLACDAAADAHEWTQRPSSCLIDGACFAEGEARPGASCFACRSGSSGSAWTREPGTCLINGVCYADGATKPGFECFAFIAAVTSSWWTQLPGTCLIDGQCYADGQSMPGADCEKCRTATNSSVWTLEGGSCFIDGVCFADGQANPRNDCEECQARTRPGGWSVDDANTCSDGDPCTENDRCQRGTCRGTAKGCAAAGQCYEASVCDPQSGECSATPKRFGSPCDDGDPCTEADRCENGECLGAQVQCPAQECEVPSCGPNPAGCSSSPAPDGTACSGGTCHNGACEPPAVAGARRGGCGTTGAPLPWVGLLLVALATRRLRVRGS